MKEGGFMKITNILKDGTVVKDMSTVVIPSEIIHRVIKISEANQRKEKK